MDIPRRSPPRAEGEDRQPPLRHATRTGELISPEDLYLYYRKVCQFLDMDEGERKVNDLITEDQLDMLLCVLPFEEAVK